MFDYEEHRKNKALPWMCVYKEYDTEMSYYNIDDFPRDVSLYAVYDTEEKEVLGRVYTDSRKAKIRVTNMNRCCWQRYIVVGFHADSVEVYKRPVNQEELEEYERSQA